MTVEFNDATRAQIEAARPDASTWLSANAGSGKTRVLTDRVARLLLDGVDPQQILCLTYTKAAASEMQNRLFKRLGAWAMLRDAALRGALEELGIGSDLPPDQLRDARTLFARAIETPGGLKIQTIHSFCASLLRRFPLEARVSPQFTEIEDRAAELLRAEIVDQMAEGRDAPLIADIARHYTGEDFGRLTASVVGQRDGFEAATTMQDILVLLGHAPDLTEDRLENAVFLGGEAELIRAMIPALIAKGGNDEKAGVALQSIADFDLSALPVLESVLLTGSGAKSPFCAKIGAFPTKPTQTKLADLMPAIEELMLRVEDARDARLALRSAQKTHALHRFAERFLTRYAEEKQKRGWLDFDDLILKARALLNDPLVAAWVLYRIDGGIDHILVDEAQDTSLRQWDVIERIADEFHSGRGVRPDLVRTIFVVGDKKQSIYSFQGADPRAFDEKRRLFDDRFTAAGQPFQRRSLEHSFRSSSAILRIVDSTFDPEVQTGFDKDSRHLAFKATLPGRVDLWPVVEKTQQDDDRVWTDPVDRRSARHHTVLLAERIAAQIKTLVEEEHYIPDDGSAPGSITRRRIRAGDFLILVQRRSALFAEIIRACKAAHLPIAGADRLKVGAELAVKDLAAILSFLATPDDSLSLATALRSPLFGWSEQDLFSLAHHRTEKTLWQALRGRHDRYPQTLAMLRDLRAQTDFLRPYDLIERILTRHAGRPRLLARLGPEAEDGINALLTQALAFERSAVPSLTGFLEWMKTDDLEIKRQIDSASDQIRVMTVHGAKGLEAPIVILPDTGQRPIRMTDEIVKLDGVPVWKAASDDMPAAMRTATDGMKDAQAEERLRLLYVAMTRAEKWLIVAAAGDVSRDGSSWHQIVAAAMDQFDLVETGTGGVLRFEEGNWDAFPVADVHPEMPHSPVLEPVFTRPVPIFCHPADPLSPSDLGGAKALAGDAGMDEDSAKFYGSLVHGLLEYLPPLEGEARAVALDRLRYGIDPDLFDQALSEVEQLLANQDIAHVFARETLAEVPLSVSIGNVRLHGIIDRLIVTDDTVLAIDFKTNRVVPETPQACPEGLLRQMGAYAQMLARLYPDREVQTAILWTRTARLMVLPYDIVTSALHRAPYLDDSGSRS